MDIGIIMPTIEESTRQLLYPASSRPHLKEKPAIVHVTEAGKRLVTYQELEVLIDSAQELFLSLGVNHGQCVVLNSPNSPELVAAIFALWRIGATAVPVDFRITPTELVNVARRLSRPVLLHTQAK